MVKKNPEQARATLIRLARSVTRFIATTLALILALVVGGTAYLWLFSWNPLLTLALSAPVTMALVLWAHRTERRHRITGR